MGGPEYDYIKVRESAGVQYEAVGVNVAGAVEQVIKTGELGELVYDEELIATGVPFFVEASILRKVFG